MKNFMKLFLVTILSTNFLYGAEIDLEKSSLKWLGTKVTGKHYGELKFKSGTATVKEGKLTGGSFVVDMNSLTVTDLKGEWATKFLGHMKSNDFFMVEKYPTASLKITEVKGNKVTAELKVKDKTGPVKFDISQKGKEYSGKMVFDRTKFGMIYNSGNFAKDLGDKLIHDEVTVDFKFVLK